MSKKEFLIKSADSISDMYVKGYLTKDNAIKLETNCLYGETYENLEIFEKMEVLNHVLEVVLKINQAK